jgi:hypothetical protein
MSVSKEIAVSTPAGRQAIQPLSQGAKYSEKNSSFHRPYYDDYNLAKLHILQAVGDLSDFHVFGRQVVIAVFCRPNMLTVRTPDGGTRVLYQPVKALQEDHYQTKAGLILRMGPGAFHGDDSYLDAMFGEIDEDGAIIAGSGRARRPRCGDWLFANAAAGIQTSLCGDGASRPQGTDQTGEPMDLFEWEGWPCRVILDDNFIGRLAKPHVLV